VLKLLKDISTIFLLPQKLSQLKVNIQPQLPLLPLRQKQIPVLSIKLPTLSSAEKNLLSLNESWMYFLDPISLINQLLNSKVFCKKLYIGMAHFVDCPGEL